MAIIIEYEFDNMRFHRQSFRPSRLAAIFVVFGLGAALPWSVAADPPQPANLIKLEVFVRSDSERCQDALKYVKDLTSRQQGLQLVVHDVLEDSGQLKRLWDLAKQAGYEKPAVPMFYCCRKIHIGFDQSTTGPKIEDLYTMHVYTRWTCPRCKDAKAFLNGLQKRWPGLKVVVYEITADVPARDRWTTLCQAFRVTPGLPTILFSNRLIVGYRGDTITGREIESLVEDANGVNGPRQPIIAPRLGIRITPRAEMTLVAFGMPAIPSAQQGDTFDAVDDLALPPESDDVPLPPESDDVPLPPESDDVPLPPESDDVPLPPESDDVPSAGSAGRGGSPPPGEAGPKQASDSIKVPLFGDLQVSALGLPAFTFLIGLIDGFNPCAMWVLVFLLSVLVNIEDRRKMIAIAGTFVVISGVAYFAFMAAWLNAFMLIGITRPVQIGLGSVAMFIGIVNIKDFFAFKKGLSFSIPESQKPGIYARVRKIVTAKYLTAAISAAVVLAVVVNIVELLCTAGLPALYSQILIMQELPTWANYCYLGLYNVAYMLDDSILLGIVVITLSRRKLQEREGRWLKLISGVVIVALGAAMIFKPNWLQLAA
jgi:glutaredoxin